MSASFDLLKSSIDCVDYCGNQSSHVKITEPGAQASLNKVTIDMGTGTWFSFDPDRGRGAEARVSPLLSVGAAFTHHRACDCIIIREEKENEISVIYIDLKSGNPTGCEGKFKSMRQFVRYSIGLIKEFHDENIVITDERYIILFGGDGIPLPKRTTTIVREGGSSKSQPTAPFKKQIKNNIVLSIRQIV